MKNKQTSIRMRILRLSLISVGVAILALSGLLVIQLDYVSTNGYKSEIQSLSVTYTSSMQATVSTVKMQIEAAAKNEVINTETDTSSLKAELAKLAETTSFKDFSIADKSGKTLNDTDISDRDYFQSALAGKTDISRPVIRKTDGSMVIMMATPMPNGNILYGALNSNTLSTGLTDEFLGDGGLVYIVNKYNEVIASSDLSTIGTTIDYPTPIKQGSRDLGNNLVAYFMPIENTDEWGTIVVGNTTNAHAVVGQCLIISLSLGAILCVAAIIVAIKISRRITIPIKETTARLEKLSEGDIMSPVQIFNRRDETENLSKALYHVCEELGKYVDNITTTTSAMANGDFSYTDRIAYLGDFETIPQSFAKINEMLKETIDRLNETANGVQSGSNQIADGSQMLAEGTTRQATAVDELSSTILGISDGVNNTAKNANDASKLSNDCSALMSQQDEAMTTLLDAMTTIEKRSEDISNVIKIIEDIAFQTNILALNASIEAARAGQAGKGFAVVATEVGTLAAKSAESANSTKELIVSTLEAVQKGSTLAKQTAESIKNVTELSHQSATLVETIAEDAEKQAEALNQATKGIEDISQVIQMNSATAEESAASCEELSAQAQILADQIGKLKA